MKNLIDHLLWLFITIIPVALSAQSIDENNEKSFSKYWKKNVKTSMVSQLFTAYEFGEYKFQMIKLSLKPELKVKLHKKLRFTGIARLQSDLLDKLEPGRPGQEAIAGVSRRLLIGDRFEFELREFYIDWYIGKKSTLRLGKQQIVWGETDGIKLLDVVNPQNFREFVLEEFEDSRIPLWAAKVEFPIQNLGVEIIWVPDMSYHDVPVPNAPFFPAALMPGASEVLSLHMVDAEKPDQFLVDSDIGTKLSAFIKGWDLTLNYLFHYDDLPVFVRSSFYDSNGEPALRVQPVYKRLHTVGGTFNNALGPITLRGELAYHFKRNFTSASKIAEDGIAKSDQFMMAIGVDWMFNETMFSMQSFHDLVIQPVNVFNRKRYESKISFLAAQELLNDALKLEVLWVHSLTNGDGMIRPKASYFLNSNVKMTVGSDIFYGSHSYIFGQFRNRTRMFVGMEWGI